VKRLSWILTVPLMVLAVVFAIANREVVTLDLWPLAIVVQLPLFLLVLGSALVGLLAGGIIVWFSGGQTRRRLREARREGIELAREAERLREATEAERERERTAPEARAAALGPPYAEATGGLPPEALAKGGDRDRAAGR